MGVRFRIPDGLMREARLDPENTSAFSRRVDVSWPTANDLLSGDITQIKMNTLKKLCDVFSGLLGRAVHPGEFFEYDNRQN